MPVIPGSLVSGEQARIDRQLEVPALARLQFSLDEPSEPLRCFPTRLSPVRRRNIDLGHALACPLAGIAHGEANSNGLAIRLLRQVRQSEAAVSEAMAEGPQRPVSSRVVPFVTDRGAFVVDDCGRRLVGYPQSCEHRMRELLRR